MFKKQFLSALPSIKREGVRMRIIAGAAFGETSPVKTFSDIFYIDVEADAGAAFPLPVEYEERALFIASGAIEISGDPYAPGQMIVFRADAAPVVTATKTSRIVLLGGAPLGERFIWWNLVASNRERLERAKADWRESINRDFNDSAFLLPPDETEFIPLPEK